MLYSNVVNGLNFLAAISSSRSDYVTPFVRSSVRSSVQSSVHLSVCSSVTKLLFCCIKHSLSLLQLPRTLGLVNFTQNLVKNQLPCTTDK